MRDHRQHPRKFVQSTVAFETAEGARIEATCRDISLGGMFIETTTPTRFASKLTLYMPLPGLPNTVIHATVRWTKPDGMGVQFGVMGARETHALMKLVSDL
ncbi:PilZ domain-containing protein [Chondromyces crocatus]|uniref:PilZ domain-containing protein n=1 Tax=Chondromyces crocatus TaxID=52 RepID=A0A0K1ER65_CHOCO|nr:PilZ domain-containing protein [Chondromyces crocatus]AKT43137.1 uncharacterized protein CMC5_073650 [Chondromyces crocatus]